MHIRFWWLDLKESEHLEVLDVVGKTKLWCILKKSFGRTWLRTGKLAGSSERCNKLHVPYYAGHCMSIRKTISFSRRTLLLGVG